MPVYHYKSPSLIEKIAFERSDDGGLRAYLYAGNTANHARLSNIATGLQKDDYQNTAIIHDHAPALEVRGFANEKACTSWLEQHQAVLGNPDIDSSKDHTPSLWERIKGQSLLASSFFYIIGDIKFFTYGMKGSSPLNMAGGAFYGAGTAANMLLSRKSRADLKVHDLAQQMADHMNGKNFALPEDASLSRIIDDKDKGLIQKADDYFRHYPAEMMNMFFAAAGVCIAVAAAKSLHKSTLAPGAVEEYMLRQATHLKPGAYASNYHEAEKFLHKRHTLANWMDVGLGTMTFASGSFGALVKEKAHDPDEPYKPGLAGWWQWIQERPLAVTGAGLMVSTMCHAASTAIEYKIGTTSGKKAIFDRGVFVATNLVAEFLLAISSKGHGEGVKTDESIDNSVIGVAAEIIARQPECDQQPCIEYMAKFLGRPDVLGSNDKEIQQKLAGQVAQMCQNPWVKKGEDMPTFLPLATQAAWQHKIAQPSHIPNHLGS